MFRSIWVRVGIIAVILVGAFLLRQFVSGNAGDLAVGDCFDRPTGTSDTVEDVPHHPCTDKHDAEVVYVGNYAPVTDAYPTDAEFKAFYDANCAPAFTAYTGLDFASDATYDMSAYTPTEEGWSKGDHTFICFAVRIDGGQMTSSLKKS
jgi:hypothetical protein